MKKIKLYSFLYVVIFTLMSCSTTDFLSPESQIVPLQSLADEGDTIILIDAVKEEELVESLLGEEIGSRAKEITIQIIPTSDEYPIKSFDYNAVVEGDFPFFTTNFTLNHFTDYEKILEDSKSYYKAGDTEIGVMHKNMIGASSTSYIDLLNTVDSKIEKVDSTTAIEMYNSNFALYSSNPITLFDFGIGLTKTMISHFDSLLLLIDEGDSESMLLTAKFDVDTENNAKTLDRMIKAGYTATLKKAGEKLDFASLKLMFVRDGNIVNIINMPLSDEQMDLLKSTISASNVGI
ncbi:MAG: hypothetical protein ACPKM0_07395 [Pleomorphochaeta sp.]